jgi:hypothetical protein
LCSLTRSGQALHAADDRVDHGLDLLLGAAQRHLGDPVQHRVLVPDPLELLDELVGDLLLRARVDLMHGLVEQLDERVGDLALAQMQQRGQQDQPHRLIVAGEMAGRLDRSPCTPCGDDVRGDPREQVGRQVDLADDLELSHFRDHRRETHVPRARLDCAQRVLTGLRLTLIIGGRLGVHVDAGAQQRLDTGDVPGFQASDDGRDEHRVGLADPRVDDTSDPLRRWRLDPRLLAVPEQQHADVLDAPLVLRDLRGEPAGERPGVGDGADPKPGVGADLAAVVLDLAAREVVVADLRRRYLDLSCEVLDRVVGKLEARAREAALPSEELHHRREPEPRRPRLVAQQLPFAVVEREMLDDVVKADLATRR